MVCRLTRVPRDVFLHVAADAAKLSPLEQLLAECDQDRVLSFDEFFPEMYVRKHWHFVYHTPVLHNLPSVVRIAADCSLDDTIVKLSSGAFGVGSRVVFG